MPEAVIFDVDGTLVDSVDAHAHAWQDAFRDFGKEVPFEKVRSQIGKGGDQLMPVFLSDDQIARDGKALEAHRAEVLKNDYLPGLKPFPGVRALFQRLQSAGSKILLASSAKEDELQFYKRLAQIDDLVEAETSSEDAERSKPHPDIFEAALKQLAGMDKARIVVVGDTPYDAEAAGKAGLSTIGVLCGGFAEADLRRAGCIAIYAGPADLLAHFDESPLAGS